MLQSIILCHVRLEAALPVLGELEASALGAHLGVYPKIEMPLENLSSQQDRFAALTAQLSQHLGCTALGVVNLEDDALLVWAYDQGRLVFRYDANPMYLGCRVCSYSSETVGAQIHGLDELCRLLGVPQHTQALRSWLVRRKGLGFLYEQERLEKIFGLLGLPLPKRL
ncbi:hypothetical protein [Meiothermus hypogaeus]|uniref:Uncharacterized protein n=2 Tax=Meiothermus hypogaeus TaxID=884155 RepID=A0A511R2Z8_9DEIN|nr:hypothetical protein [Meiothermus hypogaeus]RIH80556.1 hypothetical protein Mhypo_00474 [Meiothermus hypogaeus]GEM83697.1 hypothetical protein MHY01S_18630 [Meiothermus hypogaeus NBRC 106114]